MGKPPSIPDLELPSGTPSRRPATASPAPASPASAPSLDDPFGGGIERGTASMPPSGAAAPRGKQISVDFGVPAGGGGDDFDDGLERGGGYAPAASSRQPPISSRAPPASMNLDVAYRRPTGPANVSDEPSFMEKTAGRVLALFGIMAVVAPALEVVHHTGKLSATKLLPHAFDATSLAQAGGVGGALLVASITFGYLGIKARPRSSAMIASAFVFLISSLAMVTVALVATDENPTPPDGARLVVYTLPLALALLGLGVAGRGQEPFYDGGAKRALPFATGLAGGLLIYAGIALSAY